MYKRDVVMFDLVSLTVGISPFPFRDRLVTHTKLFCNLLLRQPEGFPLLGNVLSCFYKIHTVPSLP